MYGAVNQRRREFGVLRAIGFSRPQIMLAVVIESAALGLVGGALGIGLALLTPLIDFSTVNWATGQEIAFRFVPNAALLGSALFAGVFVGLLGGLFPALKAASNAPVALRA
jgi:putative ABC transport system permease protein